MKAYGQYFLALVAGVGLAGALAWAFTDAASRQVVLVSAGVAPSNNEARRLLTGKGIYLNNRQIVENHLVRREDLLFDRLILVRRGKKDNYLVRFTEK